MKILTRGFKCGTAISLSGLITHAAWAAEANVDFSRAYVMVEQSGLDYVRIGGVKPNWFDAFFSVDFNLQPDYNMTISGVMQELTKREQLEQKLRNTKWIGTYKIGSGNYATTLSFMAVQNGYIGGEVIHGSTATDEGYLHARVAGDIINQYQVNGAFFDEDSLTAAQIAALPITTTGRHIIRVKRMRGLEYRNGTTMGSWSTNREYRMVLENGILSGTVAIPAGNYGEAEDTSEYGTVTLQEVK